MSSLAGRLELRCVVRRWFRACGRGWIEVETLSGKAGGADQDEVLYWRCRVELWRTVTEESGSEEQRSASARHCPGHRAFAIQGERHANEWCGGSMQRNSQFESRTVAICNGNVVQTREGVVGE